ncbi:MAG: FecR domain-containing protein [Candidatus Pedobacter colombiensis]|uniref:FecR domain-containing protein n=1 Tax=Candidatus Pedobacter colombiensis TaxID=3121371 RepID=A0AAJ5W9Z8_9SPHI|nr:FecR domain-containing protein [Pedobacter sp.]WEK20023.1 MAG: FecR domain-containing protein [Pedobacter sp.]
METTNVKHFQYLLQLYADHQISKDEYDQLLAYIRQNGITEEMHEVLDNDWNSLPTDFPISAAYTEKLYSRLVNDLKIVKISEVPQEAKRLQLWRKVAVAVSIILVVGLGAVFYAHHNLSDDKLSDSLDIVAGKNAATLTLANGKKIALSDAKNGVVIDLDKLSYDDGTAVLTSGKQLPIKDTPAEPGGDKNITLATPKGGKYQITLPDGTKVWLNAASSISYSMALNERGAVRKVALSGEAYFEVAKDKKHPFIVTTDKQEIEVLGTHFNINAYQDEGGVMTTLLEGSVKVRTVKSPHESGGIPKGRVGSEVESVIVLKPGEQSTVSGYNQMKVKEVNIADAIAWKNGLFTFNNANMETVMRQISRWYNVEVEYEDESLRRKLLDGSVSRYGNIAGILNAITQTGAARFKIDCRKIIVIKH